MQPWQPPPDQPNWGTPGPQYPYQGGPNPYGAPPPGYQPQPSGATAITAAVLSFLGAAAHGFGAVSILPVLASPLIRDAHIWTGYFVFTALVSLGIAAGLTFGGVLLLRRRMIGRIIIVASCGVVVASTIINFAWAQQYFGGYGVSGLSGLTTGAFGMMLSLVMPVATATLALLPATAQWCLAGPPTTTW